MKKLFYLSLMTAALLGACKSKKQATTTKAVEADPNEKQLSALQAKMPGSTMEDLQAGRTLFYGVACTRCHPAKDVTRFDEESLQKTMSKMSKKANLTEVEKAAVWKYALAVNLNAKKQGQ